MLGTIDDLEVAIGHRFTRRSLLLRALTHYSHVYQSIGPDAPRPATADNQQLEFLGDAVLGLVASEVVLGQFPEYSEGKLHLLKARLVSESHLFEVARKMDLGRYLFLGRGEEISGGRERRAMLADALEALIGAIYLDAGMDPARAFITASIIGEIRGEIQVDYKSSLVALVRERDLPLPIYNVVSETGPAHSRLFTVEVRIGDRCTAHSQGPSKKAASQAAARGAFDLLSKDEP
jgi:ribonuclease-3